MYPSSITCLSVDVPDTDPGAGPRHRPLRMVLAFFEAAVREPYYLYVVYLEKENNYLHKPCRQYGECHLTDNFFDL